jgi:DNA polymerase III subunit beta
MKFKIALSEFQKVIQKTLPAIPTKATVSILEHLHFSWKESTLQVIGTDQDITLMTTAEIEEAEDGGVLVPAKKLSELVKRLGNKGNLEFEVNPENFEIKLIATNGKFDIKGLDPDEYLSLPVLFKTENPDVSNNGDIDVSYPQVSFTKEELTKLCDKTHFSVSSDEFRLSMSGVNFEFKGESINTVSTDSFRLSLCRIFSPEGGYPRDFNVILPTKSVELLRKIDNDAVMSFIESNGKISYVRLDYGATTFITKIVDEKFPPYATVIPKDNNIIATFDKEELTQAVDRVSIFANPISRSVRFKFTGNSLLVSASDDESGNKGQVEVSCDINTEDFSIAFNYKYLLDALSNISADDTQDNLVIMTFLEPNKPVIILPKQEEEELMMLIMPIRV